jgi:HEAT repeat protein
MCKSNFLLLQAMNDIVNFFRHSFLTERLLIQIILVFSLLIFVLIAFILAYLFRRSKRTQRKNFLQKKFNSLLGEIAICESNDELEEVFFQPDHQQMVAQFSKKKFDRNILLDELAETSKKFRGTTMTNIYWLFQKTGFEKELIKNLKSKKWHKKSKAVQQLAYLQQKNYISEILSLTHHKNDLLRTEAQIAIVKLTGFSGLDFLNTIAYPVSEWQQLRLIQELSGHTSEKLGNISLWLQSENESVVNFALRLVEIYRQYQFYDEVKECLSHSSPSICKSAVIALSNICNENTCDELLAYYPSCDETLQLEIIKILQEHGTTAHLPFLISITAGKNDAFKLEAARAMMNISPDALDEIAGSVNPFSYPWNIILPQLNAATVI